MMIKLFACGMPVIIKGQKNVVYSWFVKLSS